jgi:hypothetical protein
MTTTFTYEANLVSDLHKDARGFRPTGAFMDLFRESSDEGKQQIWDGLCRELDDELARENAEFARKTEEFESLVAACLENGAADRGTAIRWVLEGLQLDDSDLMYGGSYVCFHLGLPYSMADHFDQVCKDLLKGKSFTEVFGG